MELSSFEIILLSAKIDGLLLLRPASEVTLIRSISLTNRTFRRYRSFDKLSRRRAFDIWPFWMGHELPVRPRKSVCESYVICLLFPRRLLFPDNSETICILIIRSDLQWMIREYFFFIQSGCESKDLLYNNPVFASDWGGVRVCETQIGIVFFSANYRTPPSFITGLSGEKVSFKLVQKVCLTCIGINQLNGKIFVTSTSDLRSSFRGNFIEISFLFWTFRGKLLNFTVPAPIR